MIIKPYSHHQRPDGLLEIICIVREHSDLVHQRFSTIFKSDKIISTFYDRTIAIKFNDFLKNTFPSLTYVRKNEINTTYKYDGENSNYVNIIYDLDKDDRLVLIMMFT